MADIKPGTRVGPYKILDALESGKGGMANVYRAVDDQNSSDVALKISREDRRDPRFNNALRMEVDILKQIRHPGLVRLIPSPLAGSRQEAFVIRALELPGNPWYYAMEYLDGGSLHQLISQLESVPFQAACVIASRLCDALIYLHQCNVIHLDLKPENVLFRNKPEEGNLIEPVIIDFGVAARSKGAHALGGSLHTMAPEHIRQMRGELPPEINLDLFKMDIYSLGVVVYRMWTGTYPFGGLSANSLTSAVLNNQVRPPSEINPLVPPQADRLVQAWLAKDPQYRPSLLDIRNYMNYWAGGLAVFPELPVPKKKWKFWK